MPTLKQIFETAIDLWMKNDVRTEVEINEFLQSQKEAYEKLEESKKQYFDLDHLTNPFTDSKIYHWDENLEVKVGDIKSSDLPLIKEMQFEDVVQNGENVRYRLDAFSNRMYKIPVGTKLLLKNNTEVLVVPFVSLSFFLFCPTEFCLISR